MNYQDIRPVEVAELLEQEQPLIIDQRDPQTRDKGQMADARPASDEMINALIRQRRHNPVVLVYCYHGNQSRELCGFLGQLGMTSLMLAALKGENELVEALLTRDKLLGVHNAMGLRMDSTRSL